MGVSKLLELPALESPWTIDQCRQGSGLVYLRPIVFNSKLGMGRPSALGKSLGRLFDARQRGRYTWRTLQTIFLQYTEQRQIVSSLEGLRLTAAPNQSTPTQH
jgi:hypothetical protein